MLSFSFSLYCSFLLNRFGSLFALLFQLRLFLSNTVHMLIFIFQPFLPFAFLAQLGLLFSCRLSILILIAAFFLLLAFSSSSLPQKLPQKPIYHLIAYQLIDFPNLLVRYLFGSLLVEIGLLYFLFKGFNLMVFSY